MADNTELSAGSGGDTIASDDIAGVKYQRIKLIIGADGTNDGDVASGNPLPVTGTVAVTNAGITTIAGAVSGSEMQVDVVTSALPTGAATAAKQPALGTAGTASADVITVQGIASMTALVVDGSGVTQPVSNAGITTIAGAVSGTEMQVDVVTSALPTGAATAANQTTVIGHLDGVETLLGTIDADTSTLAGAVSGTEMQVDVVAALPAGTNAIGKLAANSGVDIGDVDVTSISAGTNLIGDVGIQPRTTNGLDTMNASSSDGSTALTSTVQAIKASAGKLYGYYIYNPNSSAQFVQFYNTASGSVTVGTTSPLFMLTIPATSAANLLNDIGITFGTAMSWAATSTAGGNGAPSTALDAVCWYK